MAQEGPGLHPALTVDCLRAARARGLWCVADSEGTHALTTVDEDGNEFHILVSLVAEDEIDYMISYRWREMHKIAENMGPIAVNFVDVSRGKGRCWVDVLNHLNDGELKGQVLLQMGGLYARIKTIAEYFTYSPETVRDVFVLVAEASRGWMWQEVALGPGVESFGSLTAQLCFEVIRLGRDKWNDARLEEDEHALAMVSALKWCLSAGALVREALTFDPAAMERFWADRTQPENPDRGYECLLSVPPGSVALVGELAEARGEVERALMSAAGNLENGNIGVDLAQAGGIVKPDIREASLGVIASKYGAELGGGAEGEERMGRVLGKMRSLLVHSCVRSGQPLSFQPVPCGDPRVTDMFAFGVRSVRFVQHLSEPPDGGPVGAGGVVELLGKEGEVDEGQYQVVLDLYSDDVESTMPQIGDECDIASIHVHLHPPEREVNRSVVAFPHKLVLTNGLVLSLEGWNKTVELAVPKESAADLGWRSKAKLTVDCLRAARARGLWCVADSEGTHALTTVDEDGNEFHILVSLVAEDEIDYMISYRWREMHKIAENMGPIAVNFVDVSRGKGRCWVDVLNHLNDGELKGQVLLQMGGLYARIKTIAEYFTYSPETVRDVFVLVAEASRGWMWQEVALGPGVESFGSLTAQLCFEVIRLGRDKWNDARLEEDEHALAMVNAIRVVNRLGANLQLAFMAPADHSIWTDSITQPDSGAGFECLLSVPPGSVALVGELAEARGEVERALMSAAGNLENGNIGVDLAQAGGIVKPDIREASLGVIASKYGAELGGGAEGEERMGRVLGKMRSLLVHSCVRSGQPLSFQPVPCGDPRVTDMFAFGVRSVRFVQHLSEPPDGGPGVEGATWKVVLASCSAGATEYDIVLSSYSSFFELQEPRVGEEQEVATCFVHLVPCDEVAGGVSVALMRVVLTTGISLELQKLQSPPARVLTPSE